MQCIHVDRRRITGYLAGYRKRLQGCKRPADHLAVIAELTAHVEAPSAYDPIVATDGQAEVAE